VKETAPLAGVGAGGSAGEVVPSKMPSVAPEMLVRLTAEASGAAGGVAALEMMICGVAGPRTVGLSMAVGPAARAEWRESDMEEAFVEGGLMVGEA